MKLNTNLLVVSLFFVCTNLFSQSKKHCNTPKKEIIEDLNSITKCAFEKANTKEGKKELKISYRKVRKRKTTTKIIQQESKKGEIKKVISPICSSGVDKSFTTKNIQEQKLKNLAIQEVLFSVADRIPLFSKCTSNKFDRKRHCFNTEMSKHFAKNFYPERAVDDVVSGRIFVQFTIDFEGNVNNLVIKSQKKSNLLEKEIKRVIAKLPKFTPGSHKNMPVNVTYSLPINLNIE